MTMGFLYCLNESFLAKTSLVCVRDDETPEFLAEPGKNSPKCPYKIFRGSNTRGLVFAQFLAALHFFLGILSEFYINLSMQALSKTIKM